MNIVPHELPLQTFESWQPHEQQAYVDHHANEVEGNFNGIMMHLIQHAPMERTAIHDRIATLQGHYAAAMEAQPHEMEEFKVSIRNSFLSLSCFWKSLSSAAACCWGCGW